MPPGRRSRRDRAGPAAGDRTTTNTFTFSLSSLRKPGPSLSLTCCEMVALVLKGYYEVFIVESKDEHLEISNDWKSPPPLPPHVPLFGGPVLISSSLKRPIPHLMSPVKQDHCMLRAWQETFKQGDIAIQIVLCLGKISPPIRYLCPFKNSVRSGTQEGFSRLAPLTL